MPIGIFDSGLGGLSVLQAIHARLPEVDTIYLGDNARTPYGIRDQETIFKWTLEGVSYLLGQGAPLVILACNTASSGALRRIQQEILPRQFKNKRVLGIIRPIVEDAAMITKTSHIGVLATDATVKSHAYRIELQKLDPSIIVSEFAAQEIVDFVESGSVAKSEIESYIKNAVLSLCLQDPKIDTIILGCTHFTVLRNLFEQYVPDGIKIIADDQIVAEKLAEYLKRHEEINKEIKKTAKRIYLTTGDEERISKITGCAFTKVSL